MKTGVKVAKKVTIFGENIRPGQFHPYGPAATPLVRLFTYLLAPHLLSRTAPSEDSVSLSEVDVMFDSVCAMGSSLKV